MRTETQITIKAMIITTITGIITTMITATTIITITAITRIPMRMVSTTITMTDPGVVAPCAASGLHPARALRS